MLAIFKKVLPRITSRLSVMRTVSQFQPSFDPHTYTHGRWLDRDDERRKARELHFDFDALLNLAVKCSPGAQQVIDCRKKEGGFNRVFMILLDNGRTVVARLPVRVAGPPMLAVSSEVATLQFVRDKTSIPVPNVLSWSSGTDNAIGAEYIIMDEMPGVLLKDIWNTMTASQHIQCIQSLGHLSVQVWQLSFPSYGSLYLNTSSPTNAVPLDATFSIGPFCASHHWDHGSLVRLDVNKATDIPGPWHSLEAYLSGLISQARSFLPDNDKDNGIKLLHTVEARNALLDAVQKSMKVIIDTVAAKDTSGPTLSHPDFHTRNIFVNSEDPTKITGIIDWQWAAIEPSFMLTAETPDFAEELPDDESSSGKANTNNDELSPQAKVRADAEFCAKVWAVMLQICPKSRAACALDRTLNSFLAAGSAGWLKDPVTMRSILLELGQKWEELGLPGQSFYQPCGDEAEVFKRQLDMVKTQNRLREHLARLLGCQTDGWVAAEKWDEVLPVYREEYRQFMRSHLEEQGAEDEARVTCEADQLWPFDQR